MEKQTDFLTYEGHIYDVFSHRVERTVMGTVWRFIMDDRRTLVLTPFQTPKNVPANPGLVPHCVESALSDLAGLAFGVFGAYQPQKGTAEYENVYTAGWPERWHKYAVGKFANKDRAAEKTALELIQTSNSRWRGKRLSVTNLKELRDVLFDVARRNTDSPTCTHLDLGRALFLWKGITGQDPTESICLAYNKRMPGHIHELAKQTAKVEDMTKVQAWRLIMNRVCYVAELGEYQPDDGQHEVLVFLQSAKFSIHSKEDEEEFQRVAPTEAEREEIKAEKEKLRLRKLLGTMAGVSNESEGPITRKQAAAFIQKSQATLTNLMRDKVIRFYRMGHNVWFFKNEISEDLKKHGWDKKTPTKK